MMIQTDAAVWSFCFCLAWATFQPVVADEPSAADTKHATADQLEVRTYPVADFVVPIPVPAVPVFNLDQPSKPAEAKFQYLVEHLRRLTGSKAWVEEASIRTHETTLSLIIRQTPEIHEQICDELSRLRHEMDLQVTLAFTIVTGSRGELAQLAAEYAGELGKFEAEELTAKIKESSTIEPTMTPKVTLFNRQTASVETKGKLISANAVVSADRRSVRLKVGLAKDGKFHNFVSTCETLNLRSGRTAVIHFESERFTPGLEPTEDAEEVLVIVTPRIIVQEEEEELLGIPTSSEE